MEEKTIRIPKGNPQEIVIPQDKLPRITELSKEEKIGLLNIKINEFIQDVMSLEVQIRLARKSYQELRNKDARDRVDGQLNADLMKKEAIEMGLAELRQLRQEIEQNRFEI